MLRLQWSDENWCFHGSMTGDKAIQSKCCIHSNVTQGLPLVILTAGCIISCTDKQFCWLFDVTVHQLHPISLHRAIFLVLSKFFLWVFLVTQTLKAKNYLLTLMNSNQGRWRLFNIRLDKWGLSPCLLRFLQQASFENKLIFLPFILVCNK